MDLFILLPLKPSLDAEVQRGTYVKYAVEDIGMKIDLICSGIVYGVSW